MTSSVCFETSCTYRVAISKFACPRAAEPQKDHPTGRPWLLLFCEECKSRFLLEHSNLLFYHPGKLCCNRINTENIFHCHWHQFSKHCEQTDFLWQYRIPTCLSWELLLMHRLFPAIKVNLLEHQFFLWEIQHGH